MTDQSTLTEHRRIITRALDLSILTPRLGLASTHRLVSRLLERSTSPGAMRAEMQETGVFTDMQAEQLADVIHARIATARAARI